MGDRTIINIIPRDDPAWIHVMFDAAQRGVWPFASDEANIMDGVGYVRPDAFDEPSAEAKAVWERRCLPIIEQIARARAEG